MTTKSPCVFLWLQRLVFIAMVLGLVSVTGCGVVNHSQSETRQRQGSEVLSKESDSTDAGELTYIPKDTHTARAASADRLASLAEDQTLADEAEADS